MRLTVICNTVDTPYSGMLPGYIAGHYSFDEVHIDLPWLAAFAGARFYRDEVVGIDRAAGKVLCRQRPAVPYDLCAINIGSTPQVGQVPGATEHTVPVKPIQQFNQRWLALLQRVRHPARSGPLTIAVVGGGAGGVELTLAMQYRLRRPAARAGPQPRRTALPPVHPGRRADAHAQPLGACAFHAGAAATRRAAALWCCGRLGVGRHAHHPRGRDLRR